MISNVNTKGRKYLEETVVLKNRNYTKQAFKNNGLSIELDCSGSNEYTKISYPVKYGKFSRLETQDFVFEFNLNNEIKHAKSKRKNWIHPSEWLKRSIGNDWVYYSSGGYSGVYEALGEYYLPNLTYPTNSLLGGKPFLEPEIDTIVKNWHQIICRLPEKNIPAPALDWFHSICRQTPEKLEDKAQKLFDISGSRVTVMPPDARHVDYNFIPLTISDGCLYKCRFCKIKNKKKFQVRSSQNIEDQIQKLKQLYKKDIINYNALFLGEHDALNTPADIIIDSVKKAYEAFCFSHSYMKDNYLFIFASADSLLNAEPNLFEQLSALPFQTFINIGLESYDPETLSLLGKPITAKLVEQTFETIQTINNNYLNIELSCNFVMDESLPPSHYDSVMTLIRDRFNRVKPKGCIYFSPLKFGQPSRQVLYDFYKLKSQSRLPTFLYLIQRL